MLHRAEQLLQPRSFVLAGNEEAIVLQSTKPEARLTFLNSVSALSTDLYPRYGLSFSNMQFNITANSNVVGTFRDHPFIPGAKDIIWYGRNIASNVQLLAPTQKGIILQDYNPMSINQYAGFGVDNASIIYQLPNRTHRHVFQASAYDGANMEWMRIQESLTGVIQMGIGTTTMNTNDALSVNGNSRITGNLHVTGLLTMDVPSFVTLDPATQRLDPATLPDNLVLLNSQNKLDESLLPSSFNFQYIKAQKNVGIGTRNPAQKLHVWGSAVVSERLGLGTTTPAARIDAWESSSTIPAVRIRSVGGSDALRVSVGSNSTMPSLIVAGTHRGVGIGTNIVPTTNALVVMGNTDIQGNLSCKGLQFDGDLSAENLDINSPSRGIILKTETVNNNGVDVSRIYARARTDFENGLSTNSIFSYSTGLVHFQNTSIEVDGDTILARQALTRSDMRHKFEIERIDDAIQKLEHIRGYTYHLGDDKREAGVLAQEVLNAFPEAVSTANPSCYAVRYDSVLALLIEGYHDLRKRLRILEMNG